MLKLKETIIKELKTKQQLNSMKKIEERFLLALSGGVDSIALFHILLEEKIKFSVATINYNFRENSIKEIENVKKICKENNIELHLYENNKKNLNKNEKNLEKKARDLRFDYFDKIIKENKYLGLITGHNLNDRVEWFLMQFTKGVGIEQLNSFLPISKRKDYNIYRPLIETERTEIEKYIENNNIISYLDETNLDFSYHPTKNPQGIKRNYFRKKYSNELTKEFKKGIIKTFNILTEEIKPENKEVSFNENNIVKLKTNKKEKMFLIKLSHKEINNDILILKYIDYILKRNFEHLLNEGQRKEIIKQKKDKGHIVINNIAIGFNETYIFISKYEKNITNETYKNNKKLRERKKEEMRKKRIPIVNRNYLINNDIQIIF